MQRRRWDVHSAVVVVVSMIATDGKGIRNDTFHGCHPMSRVPEAAHGRALRTAKVGDYPFRLHRPFMEDQIIFKNL